MHLPMGLPWSSGTTPGRWWATAGLCAWRPGSAIPVRAETLPPELKAQAALVVEALGEEIIFSQAEERNFIAASDAPGLLQEMQDRILALAPGYFGHADFAARFIRKKFAEQQELAAVAAFRYQGRGRLIDLTPPLPCSYLIKSAQ